MAEQHKAPTQVSIAPLAEKSGFQELVERYWKPAAGVAVVAAAAIVFTQFRDQKEQVAADESWNALAEVVDFTSLLLGNELPEPDVLAPVADALTSTQTGPWAQALEARSLMEAGEVDRARTVLDEIRTTYPDHPLVAKTYLWEEDATTPQSAVERMAEYANSLEQWKSQMASLEGPPELPTGSPQVRLVTERGDIVIGLYADRAPKHVENFLQLCREQYYDGTRFHRVLQDQLIQGGDPNSRNADDPASWGQGGPDYTIEPEITDAWHFRGVVAAAKKPQASESSGSQFYITAKDVHHYDKQYTVFGRVVEGMDLVDQLVTEVGEGDKPKDPVVITTAEVL